METIERPEQLDMNLTEEEKHFLGDLIGYSHGETGRRYAREQIWKRRVRESCSPEELLGNLREFLDMAIQSREEGEWSALREVRSLITRSRT